MNSVLANNGQENEGIDFKQVNVVNKEQRMSINNDLVEDVGLCDEKEELPEEEISLMNLNPGGDCILCRQGSFDQERVLVSSMNEECSFEFGQKTFSIQANVNQLSDENDEIKEKDEVLASEIISMLHSQLLLSNEKSSFNY